MTNKIAFLFVSILILISTANADPCSPHGGCGGTMIPFFRSQYHQGFTQVGNDSIIALSNVTENTVDITITIYDGTGSIVTDDGVCTTGDIIIIGHGTVTNCDDDTAGSTIEFTLGAGDTIHVRTRATSPTSGIYGYGTISWSQSSSVTHALLGTYWMIENNYNGGGTLLGRAGITFPLNNGHPF